MNLRDFLGGHPLTVAFRLALLSIIVGAILAFFGITPGNLFSVIDGVIRTIYDLGFGAIDWMLGYLALGAMLVVPIWFVLRLLRARPGRES